MNKKGFTLAELLGVIVLLGILAVVAFPPLLNQLNKSKDKLSEATVKVLGIAAEQYIDEHSSNYPIKNGNVYCIKLETLVNYNYLKSPIMDASSGEEIDISNNYVKFKINKYNDYEYELSEECIEERDVADTVPPTITANGNPITTSNSIMIGYIIEENESGLKEVTCKYGTAEVTYDKDENVQVSESVCSIKKLTIGTYYYQVCATDYGMNSACIEGQATTSEVPTPIIEYKDKDGNNVVATETGYVKKDYMTVTFNNTNVEGASNYIKTNVDTNIILKNASTIKVCGSDTNPGECSETTTTTLSANTWYKLEGNLSTTVEFIKEGELVALTKDAGGNINANNGLSRHIIPLASQIEFDNTNVNSTCENLDCALDELYEKAES